METHILSIDIGTKNFAVWVDAYPNSLFEERAVPLAYEKNGTATPPTRECVEKIAASGRTVFFANEDVQTGEDSRVEVSADTLCTLTDFLDSHMDIFSKCEYIVVEKQMQFGKIRNTKAVRVSHHVQSYFLIKFGRFANVCSFPAYHKTQVLGAEKVQVKTKKGSTRYKAVDKPTRKKWAVAVAEDILLARQEWNVIDKIACMKKRDDVSDCLLQSIAFVALIKSGKII